MTALAAEDGGSDADEVLDVRDEITQRRGRVSDAVHTIGHSIARPSFFLALALAHVGWVVVNSGVIPGAPVWDPYPFTLLATIASVEAPFLSLLILMRQQQDAHIRELASEVNVQVALGIERKVTDILNRIDGSDGDDKPVDPEQLLERIRRTLHEDEGQNSGPGHE